MREKFWWLSAKKIDTIFHFRRIMILTAEKSCISHNTEVILMKIVVVKPKMLGGILRLMFGIKKEA